MTVTIGRLRPCPLFDYKFVALGHNTIRGAAGAAILNAELMHSRGTAVNVIMKFGGTSVADAEAMSRVLDIVRAQQARGSARHARLSSSCRRCRRSPIGSSRRRVSPARARATPLRASLRDLLDRAPRSSHVAACRATGSRTLDDAADRGVRRSGVARPHRWRRVARCRRRPTMPSSRWANWPAAESSPPPSLAQGIPARLGRRAAGARHRSRAHRRGARHVVDR